MFISVYRGAPQSQLNSKCVLRVQLHLITVNYYIETRNCYKVKTQLNVDININLKFQYMEEHWGDPDVDGRIILRRIFRKWDVGVWSGLSWLRIGTGGGHL
jgi:hypothetical protein